MRKLRKAFLFISSALVAALAMDYPHTLWFFLFIFLIPILYGIDTYPLCLSKKKQAVGDFAYMFLFGFIFATCSTYWFLATYPLDWMKIYSPVLSMIVIGGIWVCFGIAMGLPIALWVFVPRFFKISRSLFVAIMGASGWVILEYARSWFVAIGIYGSGTLFGPHHTYYSLAYPVSSAPLLKELLPVGVCISPLL